jgi:hypothetical protein
MANFKALFKYNQAKMLQKIKDFKKLMIIKKKNLITIEVYLMKINQYIIMIKT